MIELRRVILIDWYLFRVEQFDIAGLTALVGPNGAGKSAIIDAMQTVLTGANMTSIRFNASAQSSSRSKRSIRDYCLGVVSLDEKGERSEPTRDHSYTYAVLGFVDASSDAAVNIGVAFSANATRADETCEALFLVRGGLMSKEDLLEPLDDDEVEIRHWDAVRTLLRLRELQVEDRFGSASDFVEESLRALSPAGFPLEPRRFIKAFRNALQLKPVENPTEFVRNYVLDAQPIRVDRLKSSIEVFRYLTARIEDLKKQAASLGQIERIVARTNENERLICLAEWQAARLRWERFRREVRVLQRQLKGLRADAEKKKNDALAAEAKVTRLGVDHTRVELTLKSSDAEQLASMYESDRNAAIAERRAALEPVKAIQALIGKIETLVARRIAVERDDILQGLFSAVLLASKPAMLHEWIGTLPDDWEIVASHLDIALAAVSSDRLEAMQRLASERWFAAQKEASDIQDRIAQIDSNLKRLDQGLSPIESGTQALINALAADGIKAEPLCDIVDVRDQKWRVAAEAALGWSREALIVEPTRAVRALDIYRAGTENEFRHAEVVNTTKTDQTRPATHGSIASIIKTDNPHARAFLDYRLGRLMMVETMDKLLASENAITPDRMMQSGRTVKRLPHPGMLKLGRANIEETRRLLQAERAECIRELGEKARIAAVLKQETTLLDDCVRGFEDLRKQAMTCASAGAALARFDKRIAKATADMEEAKRSRDPKLVKELERLTSELATAKVDKTSADGAYESASRAESKVTGNYERIVREEYEKLRGERRSCGRYLTRGPAGESDVAKFETKAREVLTEKLGAEIDDRRSDAQYKIDERRPNLQRELSSALSKHCESFRVNLLFSFEDASADVVGPWASEEKQRLEGHELVKYEEQCRTATGEMTAAFRDDMLHRLHDAFEGIKETLGDLNRHLKDRLFHGRDVYNFRSNPAPTHADLIELVKESRRPDFELPLFTQGNEPETPVTRARKRIEQILSDPQAKTDEIEDPRKYFNFELFIQDESGKIRSSLSSRVGTGSGGEGQLPFYIAVGASLAATYQNRRTGESGLSLAIFDEAFSRLDTKAIGDCSEFMRSLGLQVVLATPDEKRHIFMEVADTIVNVNRSANQVVVDTEYLKERTRETLSEADPYRKGFDAFKAEMAATASVRQEAAE
jgi:uncharacterized protein YPO0396